MNNTELKHMIEKAKKWDALEEEYFKAVEVDEETGEDLNPDMDLCTLGEILQKWMEPNC